MSLCRICGDIIYNEWNSLCPACVRDREREERHRIELERQERQRQWQLEQEEERKRESDAFWDGLSHGDSWGYNMDDDAADYYFNLEEDGGLSWSCEPKGYYGIKELPRKYIINGFLRRMNEIKPKGATYQYMIDNAYYAGSNGLIESFYIPHETNGVEFRLNLYPNVLIDLDDNGSLTWTRDEIFKDKKLMKAFDKGLHEYMMHNEDFFKNQVIENRKQIEAERKEEVRQARSNAIAKFFTLSYLIITSLMLGYWVAILCNAVVALIIWNNKDEHEHPLTYVLLAYTLFYAMYAPFIYWITS